MGKADIYQVAKEAGVSISTVSRAFTRPELVSAKTRRKVLDVADKLDFNISRSATALKSGQTYRVAMLMNEEITSWFNTQTFAGIESVMHPAGYDISLFQHIDTAANRHEFFTDLPIRRNVDAVSWPRSLSIRTSRAAAAHSCADHRHQYAVFRSFDATISIDDEKGMYTAAQHLINLGHKHIVYPCSEAAGLDSSIDARAQASSTPARTPKASTTSIGKCSPCRAARPSPTPHYPRCWRWMSSRTQSAARWI